jgi:hypothetical protein
MITLDNINRFRESYRNAVSESKEIFIFEGSEVLTDYAKYVIMYFDSKIEEMKIRQN